jgi:hypothetical protein
MNYIYNRYSRNAYNERDRSWVDAMIEARNENRPFSWI